MFDDGLGFRYEFPEQDALGKVRISDENTQFKLTGDHLCWWQPGDWDIYEHLYNTTKFSEIDAISKLNTDSAKSERFEAVAGREGLRPAEQVHLINAVYKKLITDSSKERVLLRLIGNPNFSHAGKEAILIQLDKFSTDSAKLAILRAIGERGTLMGDIEETEEDVEVEGETE